MAEVKRNPGAGWYGNTGRAAVVGRASADAVLPRQAQASMRNTGSKERLGQARFTTVADAINVSML